MKVRTLLEGAGAGILLTFPALQPHLDPYHADLYHQLLPTTSITGGLAIDLVVISLCFSLAYGLLQYFDTAFRSALWLLIFSFLLVRGLTDFAEAQLFPLLVLMLHTPLHLPFPRWVSQLLLIVAGTLIPYSLGRKYYVHVARSVQRILAAIGFSIFWLLPQLAFVATRPQPFETASYVNSPQEMRQPSHRIVWILFDELSYNLTYDHPLADVPMPNFQNLGRRSVIFSNLKPDGYHTQTIIPSLFLGKQISETRSSLQGQLSYRSPGDSSWHSFDPNATIFADAERLKWNTGIAGWYNPYCRLFGFLNSCYWTPYATPKGHMQRENSAMENAVAPLQVRLPLAAGLQIESQSSVTGRTVDHRKLTAAAESLLSNENIGFVFIHLAVPHPPGIYNRRTHSFAPGGTYLDNLVLADDTLSDLLAVIGQTSLAPNTTLIISSDHSWRVPLWRSQADWTTEEEDISGGKFDDRPVLLIHFPGQERPQRIAAPFQEIKEHDIIDEMLKNPGFSQPELDQFLQHNTSQ